MAPEIPVLSVFDDLPGIRAFFTTRAGGISPAPYDSLNLGPLSGDEAGTVRENWSRLLQAQGMAGRGLALPRLCHGAACAEVGGEPAAPAVPGAPHLEPDAADAVYTRSDRWVLAVTMADCLTALIADPSTRCVAAVHAGWKGTRDRVLQTTLEQLFESGVCNPSTTRVALGPCLSIPALEISENVAVTLDPNHTRRVDGRYYFDLTGANRAQALKAGARAESIVDVGLCTRSDEERFFSYRRDAGKTGRMAACIALI